MNLLLLVVGAGSSLALSPAELPATTLGASADTVRAAAPIAPDDSASRRAFDIPSQPVADALADFARQAGVRVTADGSALRGVRSTPVSGTLAAADALRTLLDGTGLTGRFLDDHTVAVRSPAADTVQSLARVVVTATGSRRSGYTAARTSSATKTDTPLRDTPQSVTVVTSELIADQAMQGMADVVRYTPGVTMGQGEGHRDAPTIRGNSSTADFFVDGVRDDAQFLRDLYNTDRVETLKGSNAMIFGRGGGGGVINRVLKDAQWVPVHSATVQGGSYDQKRIALDVGQGLGRVTAVRLNGMYENSGSYREQSRIQRMGINPTVAFAAGARTTLRMGYEHFRDDRTVDRGLPSFRGGPAPSAGNRFFGNPDSSLSEVRVNSATAMLEHRLAAATTIRNRTQFSRYDKYYQNIYPGSLNPAGTLVSLSAYSARHDRQNLFNQTDLTTAIATGPVMHTLLLGAELGRQGTQNERLSGFFNNTSSSITVPFDNPVTYAPVTFRATASDANNDVLAGVAGVYLQDQVALSKKWQLVAGLRYDRFDLTFEDHGNALRTGRTLERTDEMLSPRVGLVFKPRQRVSVYSSYGVSHLPSAGDQFASLTPSSQTLEPERFENAEVGAKWDVLPQLTLTAAAYRLDRTNTSAPDPSNPAVLLQTGHQRTTGHELGISGSISDAWQVSGGYGNQVARVTSTTSAAPAGRTVPLVPRHTASLWNRYQVLRHAGAGLGVIHQSRMFAAIDNTVLLPSFTRFDGALFFSLGQDVRAQLNVENLLNNRYYPTSHGNNNIMPGATRTARVSVSTGF